MFSLPGLPKLLLLALVCWLVWRTFSRAKGSGGAGPGQRRGPQPGSDPNRPTQDPAERAIEDMVECPRCGAYVPAKGGHNCQVKS